MWKHDIKGNNNSIYDVLSPLLKNNCINISKNGLYILFMLTLKKILSFRLLLKNHFIL